MDHTLGVNLRLAVPADLPFVGQMLFEAFFWRPHQTRPAYAEFAQTSKEYQKLLAGWGRPGDKALIAETGGEKAGAAWYRYWSDEIHSYGYVDASTPEIGIGVVQKWRGRGIGRALLRRLLEEAQHSGIHQISLSVEPDNPARELYQSEGFTKVGQEGGSWTMVKVFSDTPG